MCRIKQEQPSSSWESTSSSIASTSTTPPPPGRAKRPAGRTKFRETRRWVCEVRVPGSRGAGSGSAPSARPRPPRVHDAAMLALRGACGAAAAGCLNFPNSAWLLDVSPPATLRAEAADGFLRMRPAADDDTMSATSEPAGDDDAATETEASSSSSYKGDVLDL